MQLERIGLVGAIVGVVLGGLVAAAGCEGAGDAGIGGDEAALHGGGPFHRGHRGHDAGGAGATATAGTTGSSAADGGAVADCDTCTKAQQCCDVVEVGGPGCSFSAATCSSMAGEARGAYVNACLTYLVTVRGAWRGNPPAECR